MTKRISSLGMIVAIGLTCAVAKADVWVTGTLCKQALGTNTLEFNDGTARNATASGIFTVCPIPVAQNVGTSQQFEVRVSDASSANFSCFGLVIGTNGEILASTSSANTSGTGEFTMAFSATTAASSDDYSYLAFCTIPGSGSQLENLRVF